METFIVIARIQNGCWPKNIYTSSWTPFSLRNGIQPQHAWKHIANYREMSQNFIAKNIPEETLIYIYYFDHDVNEKSPFTCWWVTVVNSYGGYGVYSYGNSCQSPRVSKDTRFLRTQNRMWLRFQKNDNMTYIFNYKLILTKLSLYLYGF